MAFLLKRTLQTYSRVARKFPYFYRTLTTSGSLANNYEGDGKTTVTILNKEYKNLILIDSYSNFGFRLNNGIFVMGPLAVFPRTVLQWNVDSMEGLTPDSLSLFFLLEPKIDIMVIGTGDHRITPDNHIMEFFKSKKIRAEILSTKQACSIFNFLNSENRCVAGAFIPPESVIAYPDELEILAEVETMQEYNKVVGSTKIE